jgi:nucleoside-diphosphate-sugar epimerase
MKILITGSTGFVGSNLVDYYTARGHDVRGYLRTENLADVLKEFAPDAIINSAAEIYDPELMFFPNIVITQTCLEYVKTSKQWVRMVQIGSSSEYGPTDHPTSEDTLLKPVDYYQGTKGAATLMCQGWARQFNLPIWIARPYSVYGPGERPHRLFPRLYRAFSHRTPMTLYQGYHDFIYIDDFVRGINGLLMEWDCEPGEVVNFGSGRQISNFEVLDTWIKITHTDAPVSRVTEFSKAFENNVWVCDTSRAREKYGFETEYDLYSGIRKFLLEAKYDA